MILCCMVLHAGSSILKTMGATMMIMAIGSFVFTCVEFHAQSNRLVVVEAPSAPILDYFCKFGAFCFSFAGSF